MKETKADGIIVAPGHLSHKPPEIKALLDNILEGTNVQLFGLLNCYGTNTLSKNEDHLKSINELLEIKSNKKGDHKKRVFVFKYKQDCSSTLNKQ